MDDLDLGQTLRGFRAGQKVFERYTLKKILGRGGMGVVWLARDETLELDVALKFLSEIVAADPESLSDLKRETRRSLLLTHPNIVRIYDFVEGDNHAAISMEYVEGATLAKAKLAQPEGHFEAPALTKWVEQLCAALDYAHTKAKVVHRDLKPANLMLDAQGDLKITDFGISATLSDTATRVSKTTSGTSGSPNYMSPQQMLGDKPASSDDVYAIGSTLYELLTGKPPFYTGNVLMQVQQKAPPSMAERRAELGVAGEPIPDAWEQLVARCLAKDPADRLASAGAVARLIPAPTVGGVAPTFPAPSAAPKAAPTPAVTSAPIYEEPISEIKDRSHATIAVEPKGLAEEVRRKHLSYEKGLSGLGAFLVAVGAGVGAMAVFICLIQVLFSLAGAITEGFWSRLMRDQWMLIWILITVASAICYWSGRKLQHLQPLGRYLLTLLCAVLGIWAFPIGTIVSPFILWFLWSKKASYILSLEYAAIMAATPQIGPTERPASTVPIAPLQPAMPAVVARPPTSESKPDPIIARVPDIALPPPQAAKQGESPVLIATAPPTEAATRVLVTVQFVSTPPGAQVRLTGEGLEEALCLDNSGKEYLTPFSAELTPGTYRAHFSKEDCGPVEVKFTATMGELPTVDANLPAASTIAAAKKAKRKRMLTFAIIAMVIGAGVIAVTWFLSNTPEALYKKGLAYYNGDGVAKDPVEAAKLVRKAADQGYAAAQNSLGFLYANGEGVAKDPVQAVAWYRKAADQGNIKAQGNLGWMYANGDGVAKDPVQAVAWYRKAAEHGNTDAQFNIGLMYANGEGVAKDPAQAVAWYRKAAEHGTAEAQNSLGLCYMSGQGVTKDSSEAVAWYHKAAEQNNTKAQNNLGYCYLTGDGVAKDLVQAAAWYSKAADQGDALAQMLLGFRYSNGEGVTKDLAQAVAWFRKAADQGLADAQNVLGGCYDNGDGIAKDPAQAVAWYQKAADQGFAAAQCNLGVMYQNGQGVAENLGQAVAWYQKAADQDFAAAQSSLGWMYANGQGVAKDPVQAVAWYRKAADKGFALAQCQLSFAYWNGAGVDKDDSQAAIWARKAADQNNAQGQYLTGWCYQFGRGVTKDMTEATRWYKLSADQGNEAAKKALGELAGPSPDLTKATTQVSEPKQQPAEIARRLNSIILPSVSFNEVDLSKVISTLMNLSIEYDQTSGPKGVNIILLDPANRNPLVSLSFKKGTSLKRMLEFILASAGYRYEISEDMVLVRPAK